MLIYKHAFKFLLNQGERWSSVRDSDRTCRGWGQRVKVAVLGTEEAPATSKTAHKGLSWLQQPTHAAVWAMPLWNFFDTSECSFPHDCQSAGQFFPQGFQRDPWKSATWLCLQYLHIRKFQVSKWNRSFKAFFIPCCLFTWSTKDEKVAEISLRALNILQDF